MIATMSYYLHQQYEAEKAELGDNPIGTVRMAMMVGKEGFATVEERKWTRRDLEGWQHPGSPSR